MTAFIFNSMYAHQDDKRDEVTFITDEKTLEITVQNPEELDLAITVSIEEIETTVDFEIPVTCDQLVNLIDSGKIKNYKQLLVALKNFEQLRKEVKSMFKKKLTTDKEIFMHVMMNSKKDVKELLIKLFTKIKKKENLRRLLTTVENA